MHLSNIRGLRVRDLGRLLAGLVLLVLAGAAPGQEREALRFSTSPVDNGGKPWRVAYYEGGPHGNYHDYLRSVVDGLIALGWIEARTPPETTGRDSRDLWQWLVRNGTGRYLHFVADGYYSAGWDQAMREQTRAALLKRLNARDGIDLMFAMGTWAGHDLSTNEHSVPTIVMSTSEPVRAGIIKDVKDSGRDHIHARVDPYRYERQIKVFHDIIEFRTLGVAFEDTPDGRTYAAMDTVERVARERGFELVVCHTKSDVADQQEANQSVVDCFEELAGKVDALYVTVQGGVNRSTIPQLVQIANSRRIPTFSQGGSREVSYGMLMSISRPSFRPVGRFLAATVAKVLNGAKPRQLTQLFEEPASIAINLKTAELIGLYLYADVLAAADEIYREIGLP